MWVGSDQGLFKIDLKQMKVLFTNITNENVYDVAVSEKLNVVSVGTMLRLWIYK